LQLAEVTEGSEPRYKCLVRDVTEIHSAQRKIEKAKLEAELANKSRSEFLANMSHELRTPLNAILGFAQMIEGGTYGEIGHPKYHDYIGSIQESGTTLLSKINDLLEIANIDSGRMALNEAPTDLVGIIRHAIEAHSHHAFSEQVSLRDRLPDEPLVAVVDRIRLLQVLTNLISNAIKYNRQHGTVDIFCENRKDGGINIVIQDNGGGIPESHLQRILLAFEQDNSFFARSRNCVGLGLALSKEIVKLHQGRIHIESEYGKGTLLTIQLPKERTVKQQRTVKMLESAEALPVS
jgi:signal transduction histidine kinase